MRRRVSKIPLYSGASYESSILELGPIAYWPLSDTSGTTMVNLVSSGLNGSYKNTPVLGETGIGDGLTSVKFNDGVTNECGEIYSAALNTAFNGDLGSLFVWCKVSGAGVWTDGTARGIIQIAIDNVNYVRAIRSTTNSILNVGHRFGAANINRNTGAMSTTDWFELGMTWSLADNRLRCYINGVQQGADAAGLGDWSGNLAAASTALAALSTAPVTVWTGWLAHVVLFNREFTPTEVAAKYALRPFDWLYGRPGTPFDAADVDSAGNIYAGVGATIYKSTDRGKSWLLSYTIPGGVGIAGRVFVDSRDYVYVSGRAGTSVYGLYRSIDGGANWTYVLETGEGMVWGIDEDDSGNLCCGLHGFNAGGATAQIWKSTDGGANWVQKHNVDYESALQDHIHQIRYDARTGYWYATLGDQIDEKILRSTDDGENWTVVSTGGTQLLAMAFLGDYVYAGTDTASGNKIVRWTDDGSATVTLEDVMSLPAGEDVAIFDAGEYGGRIFFCGYKETREKDCNIYVFDGTNWETPYTILSTDANRGFYTASPNNHAGMFYVSADYGAVADNGIELGL